MNRVKYSQFLLSTQTNYTITYCAEHLHDISHDSINRYLSQEKLSPHLLWEHVRGDIEYSPNGIIVYDDTVLDKSHSSHIELARWHYSGNERRVIQGISVVTCIYFNPELKRFWPIDYRIYEPDTDGKSKIDHVRDMLNSAVYSKQISFKTVLMDTWYAVVSLMSFIDTLGKHFFCTIRNNRNVSRVDHRYKYSAASQTQLSRDEIEKGVTMHLKKSSKDFKVKLFRITVNPHRTEHIITNDLTQNSADAVQDVYVVRSIIEQLHREIKQTTGIENCECRKQRIQRNHILCAFLVLVYLRRLAFKARSTVYAIKDSLLKSYLVHELRNPRYAFNA